MQYILCPRCNFKVAIKSASCTTCGYDIQKYLNKVSKSNAQKNKQPNLLSNLLQKMLHKSSLPKAEEEKRALS